jgi:hypothetical protein
VATPQPTQLPARKFVPRGKQADRSIRASLDQHGFLAVDSLPSPVGVERLLDDCATLVLAPPWSGKTWVAEHLRGHLANCQDETDSEFASFHHTTLFQTHPQGASYAPEWWREWLESGKRACWVIDAIDEDIRRGTNHTYGIVDKLSELTRGQRELLSLLVFCRENDSQHDGEWCPEIGRLADLYGDKLQLMQLAPPDAAAAADIVQEVPFDRVCSLIAENRLQGIAGLPAVLKALGRLASKADELRVVDVWREVLERLLDDMRALEQGRLTDPPLGDRFRAACRIAALLSFMEQEELNGPLGTSDGPSRADVVPVGRPELDKAVHSVLGSAVYPLTGTGSPWTMCKSGSRLSRY